MPFMDMFEQESGQLLIDRRRHAAPLELLRFFTFHRPNPFVQLKLVWGDKDLFRLAWLKLDVPFFMVQSPPAVAGKAINGSLCGMTMVQYDAQGEVLFLHRNSNKLTGGRIRSPANEKLKATRKEHKTEMSQLNEESSPRSKYQIETYHVDEISKDQICYYIDFSEHFYAQEIANLSFSDLKTHLRRFAMDTGQLHQAKVDAIAQAQQQHRKPFRLQGVGN
ncbi:hypothetical protein L915_01938 [Phytophthora nicotianae]|uniref:Uncharacterized protein n=1 Tax=Phytophthora nicotianae TaxID=4792 RepID=W2HIJ6_PHYNI|nr:hypothetical protein L915_01938 [Phytophthora nicotianae]